jgi:hypothetical protein
VVWLAAKLLNRGRRSHSFDDHRPCARGGIAPGIGGDVVDGVGCHLRGVDDDVAYERAVQECFVAEAIALVVSLSEMILRQVTNKK